MAKKTKESQANKKAESRVQNIFAHAVSLHQTSRMKNYIYGNQRSIFILNFDRSVMLRFPLLPTEGSFHHSVSFQADDYDADTFREKDGRICFTITTDKYKREKVCRSPQYPIAEVMKQWRVLLGARKTNEIKIFDSILPLLDKSLSHIEFSCSGGKVKIVQRSIYTGSVSTITIRTASGNMDLREPVKNFPAVGMRTKDFMTLFAFSTEVVFYFSNPKRILCQGKDATMPFFGSIGLCTFTELGG